MARLMRFNLLGPLTVGTDGEPVVLPAGIPRSLLVLLLLSPNTVVPARQVAELLWGGQQPATAAAALRNHVSRLRRLLGPEAGARIRTVAPGYLVEVHEGELDAQVFSDACRKGRRLLLDGDSEGAAAVLAGALLLWRGEPFTDVPPSTDVQARVQELDETRLLALEGRIEADLRRGRHRELVAEMRALVGAHPLRETLHGQLMLALHRAGRQAEALEAFQGLRRTLVDELGVEPSAPLRELHRRILADDTAAPEPSGEVRSGGSADGGAPSPPPSPPPAPSGTHYQLPSDTRAFTGRTREVEALLALAQQKPSGGEPETVMISAVDGMAGIGKSALVIHVAHRLRGQFPDGQLFIDLHGHTPGIAPLAAGDALDWFLRSLGVPPQLIPQDLGERAAFYRDRLADTRTLIVLDNAASTAQVRPLLPATPDCLVLVTSRRRLTGLDDAHAMALDVLTDAEAAALVHKAAGPRRLAPDHPAIGELITLCGRMPLALRVTVARLRHHRALRLEDVVEQLRDERGRLDYLQDEDRDLTAVFDASYTALPAAEQRLFRRLALLPGPDADADAAAHLLDADRRGTERLLESLLDHNLLSQHTPGRYRFHDLLRLYARTLGDTVEPAGEREAALHRLLDHYQRTARAADRYLVRYTRPGTPASVPPSVPGPDLVDRAAAQAWMRAERENLLAAVRATAPVDPARAVALTGALNAFLQQEGPWPQVIALHRASAALARDCGDRTGEANAYHDLGHVHIVIGTYPVAADALERALAVYQDLGERLGEANILHDMSRIRHMVGDFSGAAALQERALLIFQELGDRLGEANALHDLGRTLVMTGDVSAAEMLQRALVIFRGLGHGYGEAVTLWTLGRIQAVAGRYPEAVDLLRQAQRISQDLHSRLGEANVLHELGRIRRVVGEYAEAAAVQRQALTFYRELGFQANEAHAVSELGCVRFAVGDHAAAASLQERALAIFRSIGSRQGEATALRELGCVRGATGEVAEAADLLERALAIFHDLGDRGGEAETLNCTGVLVAETAGPGEALPLYRQALALARVIRSPLEEARALEGTARCAALTGDRDTARTDLGRAVALYRSIGVPQVVAAAATLVALEPPVGSVRWEGSEENR